jgi:hypothetical protein
VGYRVVVLTTVLPRNKDMKMDPTAKVCPIQIPKKRVDNAEQEVF